MNIINIVTRTSNRPKAFKQLRESIKSQTFVNINHIVISDNPKDMDYIKENGYDTLVQINKRKLKSDYKKQHPNEIMIEGCTRYTPQNLYLNDLLPHIKSTEEQEGWVIFLNDDNYFKDENSLQLMMFRTLAKITKQDTLFIHNIIQPDGEITPLTLDNPNIHLENILFHKKWLDTIVFDAWSCSTQKVINQLMDIEPKVFTKQPCIYIAKEGKGHRKDIE